VSAIIIIDDDEEVRVATENLIQSYGLEAHTFASAEAFLASAMVEKAGCLVTDVQMSGMSGLDLQGALRRLGCAVPMVFITAYPDERVRRQVEAAGAFGVLSKPFDAGSLMSCIGRALAPASV